MDTHEIVIDYTDANKFKEGMNEIRQQMWHITDQIEELNRHHDRLMKMYNDAIKYYCDPDNEYELSKIDIPKHIAKDDVWR